MEPISEKQIEDVLQTNPELIEKGLTFIDRQIPLGNRRIDLMFTDKDEQLLVVELKRGEIRRKDIGQIIEYMGYFLERKNELKIGTSIRTMLIGSKVPEPMQLSLTYYGVEWKEIDINVIRKHLGLQLVPEVSVAESAEISSLKKAIFNERVRTGNYKWALPLAKVGEQFKEFYPKLTKMSRLPKKGPNVKILTDISHVHFEWYVRGPSNHKVLEVGVHIERGKNVEWNNSMLNRLKQNQSEFDEIIDEAVFYGAHNDTGIPRKYATRISVEQEFSIFTEDLITWAVQSMRKFYDYWNPIISNIDE